jgi:hypothetical protein
MEGGMSEFKSEYKSEYKKSPQKFLSKMNQSFVTKVQKVGKQKSSDLRALEKVNEKRIYATNDNRCEIAATPDLFS